MEMNLICINCNQYIDYHSDKDCKDCLMEFAEKMKEE
jgi:hypothetical protein